jgi:hypothetical protein
MQADGSAALEILRAEALIHALRGVRARRVATQARRYRGRVVLCTDAPMRATTLCILLTAATVAAAAEPPCASAAHAQLDFWIGDWDLRWTGEDGREQRGVNRIHKSLDGCAVIEEFDGRPDTPLVGQSISSYVARERRWRQVWVDNSGAWLDFDGGLRDGNMEFSRRATTATGAVVMQRMVFLDVAADSLTWDWQRSADEGKTWTTVWRIRYSRRK